MVDLAWAVKEVLIWCVVSGCQCIVYSWCFSIFHDRLRMFGLSNPWNSYMILPRQWNVHLKLNMWKISNGGMSYWDQIYMEEKEIEQTCWGSESDRLCGVNTIGRGGCRERYPCDCRRWGKRKKITRRGKARRYNFSIIELWQGAVLRYILGFCRF